MDTIKEKFVNLILKEIPSDEHKIDYDPKTGSLNIDDVACGYWIEVRATREKRSVWDKNPPPATPKYRLIVNGINFPQRKDGTHHYAGIAEALLNKVKRAVVSRNNRNIELENRRIADRIIEELGVSTYGPISIRPTHYREVPIRIEVNFEKALTEDRAKEFARRINEVLKEFE